MYFINTVCLSLKSKSALYANWILTKHDKANKWLLDVDNTLIISANSNRYLESSAHTS